MNRKETLQKVLRRLKPCRFLVGLSFLTAFLTVISSLLIPILIGDAVDCILSEGNVNFASLSTILFQMAAVILITALCQWVMGLINNRIVFSVSADLRREAFSRIQKLPLSYLDKHPYGDIVSRVISDVDQFGDGLLLGFTQLFTGVLTIAGTLIFMITVNGPVTLAVVLITPLSLFAARFIAKKTHVYFKVQSENRGAETACINEYITNEKTVKACTGEREALARFDTLNEALGKSAMKATFFSSLVNPTTRFVNSIVYAGVGLFGAFTVLSGGMTIGQLTCFLTYANQYTKPFNEISGVLTEFQNALVCVERVFELVESKTEEELPVDLSMAGKTEGLVEFDRVSFSYDPEKPLIQDMSFAALPGEHIAIVGRTGCGKTTLINLLMRFYDSSEGEIRIDGQEIRELSREALRKKFGMVLQETWLKQGTIRENILLGKPEATEEELVRAAKAAHAHSFIKRLPQGYDTVIGEDGEGLSQGEKQLLSITRVMLALPPMLILDEATSSIDTRTELRIQRAFNELMAGRTSFIVAHRLSTIRNADVILVMDQGKIVEKGTHEELLQKGGAYKALYESQFAGVAT